MSEKKKHTPVPPPPAKHAAPAATTKEKAHVSKAHEADVEEGTPKTKSADDATTKNKLRNEADTRGGDHPNASPADKQRTDQPDGTTNKPSGVALNYDDGHEQERKAAGHDKNKQRELPENPPNADNDNPAMPLPDPGPFPVAGQGTQGHAAKYGRDEDVPKAPAEAPNAQNAPKAVAPQKGANPAPAPVAAPAPVPLPASPIPAGAKKTQV